MSCDVNLFFSYRAFYKENRTFPTHIFFYRDGVGAGDIELVKQLELEGIKVSLLTTPTRDVLFNVMMFSSLCRKRVLKYLA